MVLVRVFNRFPPGRLHGLSGGAVGRGAIAPGFKLRPGYVRRVFHLSLRLSLPLEVAQPHLGYNVHKTGRKTAAVTFGRNAMDRIGLEYR